MREGQIKGALRFLTPNLVGVRFLKQFFENCSNLLKVNPERIPMENE
jgi:hypothetical protein